MPKTTGSATEFVLQILQSWPNNELRIGDFYDLADGRFKKANLTNALSRLLQRGVVVRNVDADRAAWWAIAR